MSRDADNRARPRDGPGIKEIGANGPFNGFVQAKGKIAFFPQGGLTIGSATVFTDDRAKWAKTFVHATLADHELGHTLQFIAMAPFGHVWRNYIGLGVFGFIKPRINPWENMASLFGIGDWSFEGIY